MNHIRRKILLFALVFLPAFLVCVLAYQHVQPLYQKAVVAAIDVGLHRLEPPMRLELSDDGGWTTFTLLPDGGQSFYWSRPGENLTLFYMSLAVLPALLIATPVGIRRRLRLLVTGMLVLYVLQVIAGFGLVVSIRCLANDPGALVCSWAKTVGNTFGQVSAFVIWVGLTWSTWFSDRERSVDDGPADSAERGAPARFQSLTLLWLVSLVVLGVTYADHLDAEFKLDDTDRIVDNLSIRSLRNTGAFFADPQTLSTRSDDASYRPLLTLSHALDRRFAGGDEAGPFRRTQLLLLAALGAVMALAVRRLYDRGRSDRGNGGAALVAALLFCVHAANAATVNDLASRADLLGALGLTASFWLYLARPPRRRVGWYLLPMFVGALAEPLTLLFAPLFVLFVWLFETEGSARERLAAALSRGTPALGLGLAMLVTLRLMDGSTPSDVASAGWGAALGQPSAWLMSAFAFVLPAGSPVVGPWPFPSSSPALRVLVGLLFLAGLAFAVERCSRSRALRPAAFGLAWFALGSLAVSLRGTPVHGPLGNPAFLPYVGLTIAAIWLAVCAVRRLRSAGIPAVQAVAAGLAMLVVATHALATHERNELWRSDETLWTAVLQRNADDPRALLNRGRALVAAGRHEDALGSLERARSGLPDSTVLERTMALAEAGIGQADRAEQRFERALQQDASDARTHADFGWWLLSEGRGPDATRQLSAAIELSPNAADSRHLLMNLSAASGDDATLHDVAAKTLAILPTDSMARAYSNGRAPILAREQTAEAYAELGRRYVEERYWLDAAITLRQAVTLDPDSVDVLGYLAWSRMKLGFHQGAIDAYRELLTDRPGSSSTWNDLGWAQAQLERFDEAVASFERAVTLDPSNARARANLAWARGQRATRTGSGATD